MQQTHSIDCKDRVKLIKFSEDGEILAALTAPNQLHFWRAPKWEKIGIVILEGFISGFSLSPDGQTVALINRVKEDKWTVALTFYDIKLMAKKASHNVDNSIFSVVYCGDTALAFGREFYSREPSKIDLYDTEFKSCMKQLELLHDEFALDLEYCASTAMLASAGIAAALWDITTGKLVWDLISADFDSTLKHKGIDVWESTCIAFSRNGAYLAIGHWGGDKGATEKVCLYSIKSQEVLGWFCRGFQSVDSVALSPDGKYIAGTGPKLDRPNATYSLAQIWSIETSEVQDQCELEGMCAVTFSPDGRFLVTGANSPDSIVFWELSL